MTTPKLAFSTLPVQQLSPDELAALCRRHRMAAEVRCAPDGSYVKGDFPLCSVGSSICILGTEPEEKVATWCKQMTSWFCDGIRGVRVFLGNFRQRRTDPARPISPDGIRDILGRLCECGPDVLIETHNEYATASALLPLLRAVDHPRLGVIWDCLHPLEDGEPIAETWGRLRGYIRHIHIKDALPPTDPNAHDWVYTRLGEGAVPLRELVQMTRRDGYDGYYSLEWESAWRPELRGVCDDPDCLLDDFAAFMAEAWASSEANEDKCKCR